ncbi:MAG TPA: BatA domain-containing protein, partial [Gemmatimonadaceae bacterium]|nr:BatA domain-containing protein [Gemmatimonadaceae bacterium]
MSFLEPLYLLLAGAAAVPLLLHLLRRRISMRVEFPAARYILRAEKENSRKLKLRNLLLMLLRILAVLFIALAAARPVGRLIGAGHAPTAVAIVLDNSLSTSTIVDGSPLFRRLRAAALAAARQATPSDRIWLVTADGRVVGGAPSSVADAIQRLEPMAGAGDLPGAVSRAVGLVRSAGLPASHVAVATDGQATAWRRTTALSDVGVSAFVPNTTAPANHAVIVAEARPPRWTPRGSVVARTLGADSATYRIAIGGTGTEARTLARGTAVTGDEILVRAAPPERGWVAGSVELEPDELRGDDVRYYAAWIGAAPAVAVDATLGPFVRTAIDALVQSERLRLGSEAAIVPADVLSRLPAMIIAPSDPVRVGAANRALERAGIPWRFGAVRRESATVREPVTVTNKLLDGASVSMRYPLTPVGDVRADTIARVGAEPWVVAGDR